MADPGCQVPVSVSCSIRSDGCGSPNTQLYVCLSTWSLICLYYRILYCVFIFYFVSLLTFVSLIAFPRSLPCGLRWMQIPSTPNPQSKLPRGIRYYHIGLSPSQSFFRSAFHSQTRRCSLFPSHIPSLRVFYCSISFFFTRPGRVSDESPSPALHPGRVRPYRLP